MCGIIGSIGNNSVNKVIHGLQTLEYRGYDSAGIAFLNNDNLIIKKTVGKVDGLIPKVDGYESSLAIGHTRWATHGEPSELNAHPHQANNVTIVHNGIIENYQELRKILEEEGYSFYSSTDTEVAAKYIDYLFVQNHDIKLTLRQAMDTFIGSYAMGIIFNSDFEHIYAIRHNAPLIIGSSEDAKILASDTLAILNTTKQYYLLPDQYIAVLSKNDVKFYNHNLEEEKQEILISEKEIDDTTKGEYEYFMLKEIAQEGEVIAKTINSYKDQILIDLDNFTDIVFVGCGSAMYAAQMGAYLLRKLNKRVYVECASEFRYQPVVVDSKTLYIFISQSGETADTLKSLELVNNLGGETLAIVNVKDSSIMRESKKTILTQAGSEIAVATTKALISQFSVLSLIFIQNYLRHANDLSVDKSVFYQEYVNTLTNLNNDVIDILNDDKLLSLAKRIKDDEHIFFLGRGIDYAIALEGSLKLKEISYIHSESYPAGELKHGSIALINDNTHVIGILTDNSLKEKTISNLEEVISRGARVILFVNEDININEELFDTVVKIPSYNQIANIILTIINLQMLAFHTAKLLNREIDQPKNLAKSVTVE